MPRSFFGVIACLSLFLLVPVVTQAANINEIAPSTTTMIVNSTTTAPIVASHPDKIDINALQTYWLDRINALRATKNLRLLTIDPRFTQTATEWATHMAAIGQATHVRPNGFSMHQWIDAKHLPFTKRYSSGGWKTNYFSENIAWGYTDNSLASAKAALDETLRFMLAEAKTNGPHYRTIYYPDWNTVGVGFYFKPVGKNRYQLFTAFHYGSLQPLTTTSTSSTPSL